ncbi:hypothetical protein BZL41_15410 [Pseudomonas sp. PIC25]|uniref:ATPase, T2SS/T4P/T4SS family n=1 Tax=Pseudomonas sp. PIC25 TaxID=1958773 RepID=UPI000BAB5CBB|nr:ATPase, T2SS/T4P/T4SS family [Pseudomonas sp. PIC25]PAU60684.1 hypothetical protein BZL41_15410 [Pseudomonas sp. PIC25]
MDQSPTGARPDIFPYLHLLHQRGGSDMFLSVGAPPHIKLEGRTQPVAEPPLIPGAVQHMAYQLMTQKQIVEFERDLEMNLAISLPNSGRFRVNVYFQRGEVAMVVRLVKSEIPRIATLGLPPILERLALLDRGLVLVVGAAGDLDSMQHALHYAETGHLCLATLHATGSVQTLERIVHFFPEEARRQILADLAQNLVAVIGQRLVPGLAQKRVAAVELMLATPYIRDLIQRDQFDDLRSAIARAGEQGLQTFDQHLYQLYENGRISLEEALRHADSRTDLTLRIKLEHGFGVNEAEKKVLRDS